MNKVSDLYELHRQELKDYALKYNLQGLEGRIVRGLDPAGMLAVSETSDIIKSKVSKSDYQNLIDFTNSLHIGGIWDNSKRLAQSNDIVTKAWFLMAYACVEVNNKDLNKGEYLNDFLRVKRTLSDTSIEDAVRLINEKAHDSLTFESYRGETIPVSSSDDGFLHAAISGYDVGIVFDGENYFVGSKEFDFDSFAKENGLVCIEKFDEDRNSNTVFYPDKSGRDVVKKLYPGFAIILNKDKNLAYKLALKRKNIK